MSQALRGVMVGGGGQTGSLIFKCLVRGGRGAQWDTAEPSAANKVE